MARRIPRFTRFTRQVGALVPPALLLAFLAPPLLAQEEGSGEKSVWSAVEEALGGGTMWLKGRYRFEFVDDDLRSKDAYASTLRSVLGYETATYHGLSGLLEFANVTAIGNDLYDSTTNGKTNRAVVADPEDTEVNQAYVKYLRPDVVESRIGRQRIILDNARFVGNVGWRQNEQTFDAAGILIPLAGFEIYYSYLENVNRIFGDDSSIGDARMDSHLVNVHRAFPEVGAATAYGYFLNYDKANFDDQSTNTYGARWAGTTPFEDFTLLWNGEAAYQDDAGDNPNDVDSGYYLGELGADLGTFNGLVGYELLEGSGGGDMFITPLATLHKFNGWADRFLVTPDDGLQDVYVSLGAKVEKAKFQAVYHDFQADSGSDDFGWEIDLLATYALKKNVTVGAKFANFDGDDIYEDALKVWFWIAVSI